MSTRRDARPSRPLRVRYEAEPQGGYSVWTPDCPGAYSQGETRAEARRNLEDAVRLLRSVRRRRSASR